MIQHDTTIIVIERDEKFLLIKRGSYPEKGFWAFPGGHVDEGESLWEGAVREAKEEVGETQVEKKSFLVFVHDAWVGTRHKAHSFRGTLKGEPVAGSDAEEFKWFTWEQLKKKDLELTDYTKRVLNFLLKST